MQWVIDLPITLCNVLHVPAGRLVQRDASRAFISWQQYTQDRLALKEAARKAFGYWSMKAQADAFQCWQSTVAERKNFTAAAAKALQYFTNRTAASAFLAWRDFADERVALKDRLADCIQVSPLLLQVYIPSCLPSCLSALRISACGHAR